MPSVVHYLPLALALTLAVPTTTRVAEPRWTRAVESGRGAWQDRWIEGAWPMAVPVVAGPDSLLYMIGDSAVWRSADGVAWTRATTNVRWRTRVGAPHAWFRGRLWMLGGREGDTLRADVWSSRDGVTWTRETGHAGWSPRRGHAVVMHDGALWLAGGALPHEHPEGSPLDDAWSSTAGVRWTAAFPQAPWTPRSTVYGAIAKNRLWRFGGKGIQESGRGGFASDMWYLEDRSVISDR